jgi:hypothetical protein
VKPGWTAGMTRGRLLLGRTIGPDQARDVASRRSLAEAVGALAGSAYGERVRAGVELVVAERAVAETLLWQLRILAGWLPAVGASLVRALAAWFELANIDARIAALADDGREPSPFELRGALPRQAALALAGLRDPSELWHAELRWWVRVEREARAMLRAQRDEAVVLAAVALLAADARRAVRALDAAAHGGSPELVELVDGAA